MWKQKKVTLHFSQKNYKNMTCTLRSKSNLLLNYLKEMYFLNTETTHFCSLQVLICLSLLSFQPSMMTSTIITFWNILFIFQEFPSRIFLFVQFQLIFSISQSVMFGPSTQIKIKSKQKQLSVPQCQKSVPQFVWCIDAKYTLFSHIIFISHCYNLWLSSFNSNTRRGLIFF